MVVLKTAVKKLVGLVTSCDIGFNLLRFVNKEKLLIIYYHRVVNERELVGVKLKDMCVDISAFEAQMEFLSSRYNMVSEREVISAMKEGEPLRCSAWVTFDDGYKDNYTNAYPILRKHKIPATFFVTTGLINKQIVPPEVKGEDADKLFMSWDEIREMHNNGFFIGAHTVHHKILSSLPKEDVAKEISESKHEIERRLGAKIFSFAYPRGGKSDFNFKVCPPILKKYGFKLAVTTTGGNNGLTRDIDNFRLKRMGAAYGDPLSFFKFKVATGSSWQGLLGRKRRNN